MDKRGVDVIVNFLSGCRLQQSFDLVAENGRFIEIGKKDLLENNYIPTRKFDRNVTFSAIDLRKIATARREVVKKMAAEHRLHGPEQETHAYSPCD